MAYGRREWNDGASGWLRRLFALALALMMALLPYSAASEHAVAPEVGEEAADLDHVHPEGRMRRRHPHRGLRRASLRLEGRVRVA